MRNLAWTPVLLALALTGCPDKDTGDTDPGTDTEGTGDTDTMDPDTDTLDPDSDSDTDTDSDTDADTEPPLPDALCLNSQVIAVPFVIAGDDFSVDFTTNEDYSTGTDCGSGNGNEARFEVPALAGQIIRIREFGGMDAVSYVVDGCLAGDACLASVDGPEHINDFVVPEDGQYLVVIGAWSGTSTTLDYDIDIDVVDPEICDDGLDNDRSGYTDCGDPACFEDALCEDVCLALPVVLPEYGADSPISGGFTSNYDFASCSVRSSSSGGELQLSFEATAGQEITLAEFSPDFDAVVRIMDGCGAEAACLAESDTPDTVVWTAPSDGTFYAVVEAYFATESDDFEYGLGVAGEQDCASDIDQDFDGYAGCDDFDDCFNTVACPFECPADPAQVYPASGVDDQTTANLPYDTGAGCIAGSSFSGTGEEVVFNIAAEVDDVIVAQSTGRDTIIHVLADCLPGSECLDSIDDGVSVERLEYTVTEAGTYTVVIEGYSAFSTTPIEYLVGILAEEVCDSGADEDLDGDADCADSDCEDLEACQEVCDSTIDEDADGDIDCDDSDCSDSELCFDLVCDDGIDSDMDGLTDCLDDDCAADPACVELICDDGIDNELDGDIDCADSDCADVEACFVCPDAEAALPLTVSGDSWDADFADIFGYAGTGGCQASSSSGGGDSVYAVQANEGDIISVNEISGGVDFIVNITADTGCTPSTNANECVYSADTSGSSETFNYTAEATGLYYVHVGSWFATETDAYEFVLNVTPPEQCDTLIDEDGDGAISCDDSDCFDDEVNCPFECPAVTAAASFPIQLVGDAWGDDNPDAIDFTSGNGCISGGGGDYIVAVDMLIGDTISTVENSGAVDFITNVTLGDCLPDAVSNTCLYSQDDGPDGGYSYTAEVDGIHYMQISSYSNSENDAYDMTISYTPAAP